VFITFIVQNQQVMTKRNIGIWIRVSDIKQVESESHIHHELRAKDFVKTRGWNIKKVYRLEALSGKSIMEYQETQRMLYDIKNGEISGLVFAKIARLARNTKELIELAEFFNKYGADLVSMDMTIDTSTPIGRHFYRTMGSMAEWEREMIVDRINTSINTRAQLGKHLGGQPPFGYKYVDKKLVVNSDEIPLYKLIFELFLEHKRKKTVARILNDKGYRTRKGNNFTDSTIRRLLTDPVSKGLHRMNYSRMSKTGVREIKPKEEWVFHKVEPIISEELWNKVNSIIQQQYNSRTKPLLNTKVHLFTKYVFCFCGARMFTHSRTKNYLCKKHCGNKINKEDLEEVFRSELHNYTVSKSEVDIYFKNLQNVISDKNQELVSLRKEKEKISKKIDKLFDLHLQGQIKTKSFKKHHEKPHDRLLELEITIEEIEKEILSFSNCEVSTNLIIDKARNLYEKWDRLHRNQKRNIIETITNKIIVGTQDITINLYKILPDDYLPSSLEKEANGLSSQ
jgi:site-specific DNA recombinase